MAERARWCRVTLEAPGEDVLASLVLEGDGAPDLGAVDEVARSALLARRVGGRVVLGQVSAAMGELLELAGLSDALVVEVEREPEGGEEPLRVEERQEETHLGDPPA